MSNLVPTLPYPITNPVTLAHLSVLAEKFIHAEIGAVVTVNITEACIADGEVEMKVPAKSAPDVWNSNGEPFYLGKLTIEFSTMKPKDSENLEKKQ